MSTPSTPLKSLSSANETNTRSKSNVKSTTVLWKVRHTIAISDPAAIPTHDIIKIVCVAVCFLLTIIGSIIVYTMTNRSNLSVPEMSTKPVNGQWSSWLSWSACSITCSSIQSKYGTMTRRRYCNSPPPQLLGQNCSGHSTETTECFNEPCPLPIDGHWAEWSQWSGCSKTCKDGSTTPLQSRFRTCSNPVPRLGGKPCDGESTNQRFCDELPPCSAHAQWSNWYIAGPCESRDVKSCALGSQRHQRQCNSPPSSSSTKGCDGIREKIEDCWFLIGCPVDIQAPLNLQVTGNNTGLFNVSWSSVPYGKAAVKYRIYKTIEDENNQQVDTFTEDVVAIPNKYVSGRGYSKIIDLRKFNHSKSFKTLAVRMSSIEFWEEESVLTDPVRSDANSIDGEWSEWGHWSHCSVRCNSQFGQRTRTRLCNNPTPSKRGKMCIGTKEENVSCMGMDDSC